MSAVEDLRERLIERINESEGELERMRAALAAYDGASAGPARPAPSPPPASRRAAKPTAAGVLAAIPADGISRARLREQIGGTEASVLGALKQLEADGQVTRHGERRATTWHRAGGSGNGQATRRGARPRAKPAAPRRRESPVRPADQASRQSAATNAKPRASSDAEPSSAPATRAKRGSRKATADKPARTSKRRTQELTGEQVERLLGESSDGLSLVALARRAGVGEPVARERLLELERSGQVRSSGSRRTSLWRWVSDEQRIAERAAELAQASKR